MRILYGVVGEGMGHATRSRVVIEHLALQGHEVKVVVSGRAHTFLVERLRQHPNVSIEQIEGLTLSYLGNELDHGASIFNNLKNAPKAVARNVDVYRSVAEAGFRPELVISDFESWAALYGARHGLPVISIDNMQIINRCRHDRGLLKGTGFDYRLTRFAVKAKVPGACHYLISTFFTPKVRKKYTSLVPPILRPEVQDARREPGEHILVYQTQTTHHDLIQTLKRLPYQFLVYGLRREASDGNVRLRAFSETQFVEDLRTARGVLAGGGFSLMSEAVALGVPMLSMPVVGQFEQELNARYLAALGYGEYSPELTREALQRFLSRLDEYSMRLRERPAYDNGMLFGCIDELIERVQRGERRVANLTRPVLGTYEE